MAGRQDSGTISGIVSNVKRFFELRDLKVCKMPGCGVQRYVDDFSGHEYEFCGRTHARAYQAMLQAQKAAEEQQKWLKRQQKKQQRAKNQGTGVDQQDCKYNCWACSGPGLAYPGQSEHVQVSGWYEQFDLSGEGVV